ncbi:MAG: metalloregulator ArsR/SmtB family transcription factor [Actinomyces sp.]|nr:metalloregulator ArsR/SmtB family transcription factor [Actinomyces sp.]
MTHTLPPDAGSFVTQYYIHILTTVNVREKQVHLLEVKVMGLREDAKKIKALTDENRLAIILALQHGEKCGCDLLEELNITQPTLSHHMKILTNSGLVDYYKEGKWMHYSISADGVEEFREMIGSYARCDCETDSSVPCGCRRKK